MPLDDLHRYHRQTLLPGIGAEGQRRLLASHALVVGCGALGTVIAESLTRAGVGRLTVLDRDVVEWTNLQRQTLFDEADARAGVPKAEAAARRLGAINSGVRVEPVVADLNPRNAERLAVEGPHGWPDAVLDGTDNFATRYLLNDLCVKHGLPLVYGGAVGTAGMTMTILPTGATPPRTPCLRCVFPDPPAAGSAPTCDTAGVLGPVVGVAASMQAAEAIKLLAGAPEAVCRGLRQFDLWSNQHRALTVGGPSPECPCCAGRRFEFLEGAAADSAALCGADAVQVLPSGDGAALDLGALAERLAPHGRFAATRFMIRGTVPAGGRDLELTVFRDGRAIVRGTTEASVARSVYARYVGA